VKGKYTCPPPVTWNLTDSNPRNDVGFVTAAVQGLSLFSMAS
jgi:hypothetical protein